MIKLLIVAVIIVALAFLMLGANLLVFKRKFPETEVGRNKNMAKLGLTCPQCDEKRIHGHRKKPVKLNPDKMAPDWESIKVS